MLQSLRGRAPLARVFWWYFVVGGTVVTVAPGWLAEPLYDRGVPLWCFILLAVIEVLYLLWVLISLWTCAFNVADRRWGYLARALVCVLGLVVVVDMFIPRSQQPPRLDVLVMPR